MTTRQTLYLVFIVLFTLVVPVGCFFVFEHPIFVAFFPGFLLIFRSCLRLYMFPNELFDPYTGYSTNDSAVFKKYNSIVSGSCMIIGVLLMFYIVKDWLH